MIMEGRRLILNDGTIIENGEAGCAQGFLWCYFIGYTLQQAASLFFDVSKTSRIVFQYGEMEDTYNGYTNCVNLNIDADGMISVCMKRSDANV